MLCKTISFTKACQFFVKLPKKGSACILLNIICLTAFSQTDKKLSTSFTGTIMVSTDGKSVFYNMGGPGVKLSGKKWSTSLCMIPSLRFFEDEPRPLVTPLLGLSLNVSYKRWIIGFPCYYLASRNIWILSAGAGVRLGK